MNRCFYMWASLSGWLSSYEISLRATVCSLCAFGCRGGWKKLSCLPVYVCFSSQYEFHSLLLLPLSEECTPHFIQYYDSLPFNCFLRGPCSPFLGWTAVFPQMHHDVVWVSTWASCKSRLPESSNFNGTQHDDKCWCGCFKMWATEKKTL